MNKNDTGYARRAAPTRLALALALAGMLASPAALANLLVTKLADTDDGVCDADCSLREAISVAQPDWVILFDPALAGGVITLTGGQLALITAGLSIDGDVDGDGQSDITLDGNQASRLFFVATSGNVSLKNLTLTRGNGQSTGGTGGAIRNDGVLNIERCVIQDSQASDGTSWGDGGAIYNLGTLNLGGGSTLRGNRATGNGGAIFNEGVLGGGGVLLADNFAGSHGGGLYAGASGNTALGNVTLVGNQASGAGGGIKNQGTLTLYHASLVGNASSDGGGIRDEGYTELYNSVLAKNPTGGDCAGNPAAVSTNNWFGDASCDGVADGDPKLGPVLDNGGTTRTLHPLPGSPLIDAGADSPICFPDDQRGVERIQGAGCDIGAVEYATCGARKFLPNDQWRMVGLPCQISGSSTADNAWGLTFHGYGLAYGTGWKLFDWAADQEQYLDMDLDSLVSQGSGYWLRAVSDVWPNFELGVEGNATPLVTSGFCPSAAGCFEIPIHSGATQRYTLISNPLPYAIPWGNVRFRQGTTALTPSAAESLGWMSKTFATYDGAGYVEYDDATPGKRGALLPHTGYWVASLPGAPTGITLLIPADGLTALVDTRAAASSPRPNRNWHVSIQARSGALIARDNVLGWQRGARLGPDRHDLREMAPMATPFLTLSFPHPGWGERAGDYGSDFRPPRSVAQETWRFRVRSDQAGRQVTLTWDGADPVLAASRLLDKASGRVISGKRGSHTFTMKGTSRDFEWVYQPVVTASTR